MCQANHRTMYLKYLLQIAIYIFKFSAGTTKLPECYTCDDVADLGKCNQVTICQEDEVLPQ